ncbi:Endonuclease/exonuclease/phosphatase [Macleaya cordata]|uniref:Endonuclease/exonuclease/phosphatase n=1 Tax=Macleaya cordata TaxID=56857 RepID=A0A200PYC3_MACCD|nr:Endonuclease/exonuclease/phosphatase [Macleaya cordata]
MKILTWNCQGFGKKYTRQYLLHFSKSENPDIMFISETKQKGNFMESLLRNSKFNNWFLVSPMGTAGGLALAWDGRISLEVVHYSHNQIHALVWDSNTNVECILSGFYGSPYLE